MNTTSQPVPARPVRKPNNLINHLLVLILLTPLIVIISIIIARTNQNDIQAILLLIQNNFVTMSIIAILVVFLFTSYLFTLPRAVYLVDFACYKPPEEWEVTFQKSIDHATSCNMGEDALQFQIKILERSGLGQRTALPEALMRLPPNPNMANARKEAEQVMFGAIDNLFAATGVKPKDIGIVIVNCSLFNPTPSLSAMIVNKYKLRGNIKSYNLGGMGCSAGVISIDLARNLLQANPNAYALVVSMENITLNKYMGNRKSMLISNVLFRVGGAAMLLSNRRADRHRSKYRLSHVVRTHLGADDNAFRCVYQQEDDGGKRGVSLSKDIMAIAGSALKTNITTLGPLVLPLSEQVQFVATFLQKKLFNTKIKPYIPDFKMAFDHFCIHAGGRAVIDELEKHLQLTPALVEPSRMTLHRFGNTSSSSIWYELAYAEAKGRIRRGQRIWQIAFGSGFKCNSAVWKSLRNVKPSKDNPWMDCIDSYPVEIVDGIPNYGQYKDEK
ncbi:hypothetical protein LUZ60_008233 [Juncus effusus]|nr:hypothetical protein LUZ60_008233 [Juncus effusus]